MTRRLYPLNAMRTFETAARHLSFVKAAQELHVTAAAVSHQVKSLEEYLGVTLFRRLPRGLLLTDTGQALWIELRDAFENLDRIVAQVLESEARSALTISVAPMFAVKWLLPRLHKFAAQQPQTDVRMSSSLDVIDFKRDAFDAAIRLGKSAYPGLTTQLLFSESVTPMCSPRLLEEHPLAVANDLTDHTLLHDDSMSRNASAPDWQTWLAAAGGQGVDASRGPRFSQPDHAIQAAVDGMGVVLGWKFLAADDLAAGRLVAPFELELPLGSDFYFVTPIAYADRPKVRVFRDWLIAEAQVEP